MLPNETCQRVLFFYPLQGEPGEVLAGAIDTIEQHPGETVGLSDACEPTCY